MEPGQWPGKGRWFSCFLRSDSLWVSRSPLGHQLLCQSPGRAVLCRFYRYTAKITSEPGASFVLPPGAQVGMLPLLDPVYCLWVSLCVLPAGLDEKLCKNSVRIISPCFLLSVKCMTKSWRDGKETLYLTGLEVRGAFACRPNPPGS